MRAEELVRRADEDVDAPVDHVDRTVRSVVDGIRPSERAGIVRELDDPVDVAQGSDGVRGDGKRDDAGTVGELSLEVAEVESRVVVDFHQPNFESHVVGELEPGRDVPVMVELRGDDLVALFPLPSGGPG